MISYDEFNKIEMRVGKIIEVNALHKDKKGFYKAKIDIGPEMGTKWATIKVGNDYNRKDLNDMQVIVVSNIKPKQVAGVKSELLILGANTNDNRLALLVPSKMAKVGARVY